MPVKKIKATAAKAGSGSIQPAARRSAGRPPKARPARPAVRRPAKAQPAARKKIVRRQPPAQPKVVVVTNQPLITDEEMTVWQTVRQENDRPEQSADSLAVPVNPPSQMPADEPFINQWPAVDSYAPTESDQRSGRLYRRLALFFIGLIAIVVMVMFYYSLIRVKITIYPQGDQPARQQTIVLTDTVPVTEGAAPAKFLQINSDYRQTFRATGQSQATSSGKLVGQVTLVNTTAKDQPLRATTRLLTANGVLYRLRNFVTVPAGGQIIAEAYADQVKAENAVAAATKFTIPGLWSGLQDKIYAVANQDINYQSDGQPIVLAADLEQAISQAKQAAAAQAKSQLDQQAGGETLVYWLDDSQWPVSSDAQVGDQKAEFTVTVKVAAGGAIVSAEAIKGLLSQSEDAAKVDGQSLSYQLSAWQPQQHQAQLNVSYKAELIGDQADQLVDKRALVGLNRQQLETYLSGQPNVASYKITWQPGFLSKVPGTDKIQLQLGR